MSDPGFYDEDYFSSTSAGSNISAMNSLLGLMGNPLFLYTQGVITPEMLLESVRQSTSEVVDMSGADFKSLEAAAEGDDALSTGYEMLKRGYSISSIMRTLTKQAGDAGRDDSISMKQLEYVEDDLNEFKKRWDAAQDAFAKVESGEYYYDGDVLRGRMETGKAMDVLAQMGLPKFLQNPMMWEVVGDPELLARASVKNKEATAILEGLAGVVDQQTGMLTPSYSRKMSKDVQKTGVDVYQEFLKKTPEGRKTLEKVTAPREGEKSGLSKLIGLTSVLSPAVGAVRTAAKTVSKIAGGDGMSLLKPSAPIPVKALVAAAGGGTANKDKVDQNDYWAKMAGSYAARAKYEEERKPISDLQRRAAEARAAADKIIAEAKARGATTAPAFQFIQAALPNAYALTAPAPRAGAAGPRQMRNLSDEEINTMSSMLAYGSNA